MGLKIGADTLLAHLSAGIYKKDPKIYNVCVDGELIRYKGMIEENFIQKDPEKHIATSSFQYLKNLLVSVETYFQRAPAKVCVFMDGERVSNKTLNSKPTAYNVSFIRMEFQALCKSKGYTVTELSYGESELQMYLQRDKSVELNVFITNDSDMLSICYGHHADVSSTSETSEFYEAISSPESKIGDLNLGYPPTLKVLDSCIWLKCGSSLQVISFDDSSDRFGLGVHQYRTLVALCGTDYTPPMFTETMLESIMSSKHDFPFVNALTDENEIAATLLLLGIRNGGNLKRASNGEIDLSNFDQMMKMYKQYIETGVMADAEMPKVSMSTLCRLYIFAMKRYSDTVVKKGALRTWANNIGFDEAVKNFREFKYIKPEIETSTPKKLKPEKQPNVDVEALKEKYRAMFN